MSLESEILRYGLKTAKAVGAAEREYERQTELSLEIFADNGLYHVIARNIFVFPKGKTTWETVELMRDSRWQRWRGGEKYFEDTQLQVEGATGLVLRDLHKSRKMIPTVQATARLRVTKSLLWKVQFSGVIVADGGSASLGPYRLIYLSGTFLDGAGRPVMRPVDTIDFIGWHLGQRN